MLGFFAEWCKVCHTVAPKFGKLAGDTNGVDFVYVDWDGCEETKKKYNLKQMPSFVLLKGDNVLQTIIGPDMNGLIQSINHHKPKEK